MTLYYPGSITSSQIAAAIADIIVADIRENNLGMEGMPQVTTIRARPNGFTIVMRFDDIERAIPLSDKEAESAVTCMKHRSEYDRGIYDRVQKAIADMEGEAMRSRIT